MGRAENFLASYFSGPGPFKLELGAGPNRRPGWLSTDLHEREHDDGTYCLSLDATRPFFFQDNQFGYAYCEHMIEHIPLSAGRAMLAEVRRVLSPGGVLRVVTPSLGFLLRVISPDRGALEQQYLEWSIRNFVPDAPASTNAIFLNNFVRNWGHVFVYDRKTLSLAMKEAGFRDVVERPFGQSNHAALSGLESASRLPAGFLELESMVFEGTK